MKRNLAAAPVVPVRSYPSCEPNPKDISNMLGVYGIVNEYKRFGLALGLEDYQIAAVRLANPHSSGQWAFEIACKWRQSSRVPPTWEHYFHALTQVNPYAAEKQYEYLMKLYRMDIPFTQQNLSDLQGLLVNVAHNWMQLGVQLHVDISKLHAIQRDEHDVADRLLKMLGTAISKGNLTPQGLIKALRTPVISQNRLAAQVERVYQAK